MLCHLIPMLRNLTCCSKKILFLLKNDKQWPTKSLTLSSPEKAWESGGEWNWESVRLPLLRWGKNEFFTFTFQPTMCHLVPNLVPISFSGFCIRWGVSYWESQSRSGTLGGTDWTSQRTFSGDSHAFIPDCWVLLSVCVRTEAPERPVTLFLTWETSKERIPETPFRHPCIF